MKNIKINNISELKIMLNKITLLSLLLFFFFGVNVIAHSHLDKNTPPPAKGMTAEVDTVSADTAAEVREHATTITTTNEIASTEPAVINYVLPAIMVFIIIIGFGSYWLIFRRKQI
jgi:hypothetical protein